MRGVKEEVVQGREYWKGEETSKEGEGQAEEEPEN